MQRVAVAAAVVALVSLLAAGPVHGSQAVSHRTTPCSHHGVKAAGTTDSTLLSSKPSTARRLLQKKYQISPDPDNKGCYLYRASASDTIEQIGKDLGVSAADLKERNSKNIADMSRLSGRFVEICGITNFDNAEGMGGGPITPGRPLAAANKPPPAPAPEPAPAPAPAPNPAPKPGQTTTTTTQTTTTTTASPPASTTSSGPTRVSSGSPISIGSGGIPIPFLGRRRRL